MPQLDSRSVVAIRPSSVHHPGQQQRFQQERNEYQRKLQQLRDELDMAHRQIAELHAMKANQNTLMKFAYVLRQ
jgi:uncharacterized protein YukE